MVEPVTEEEIGSERVAKRLDSVEDLELKQPTLFLQGIVELQPEEELRGDSTCSAAGLLVVLNFLGSCHPRQ